MQAPTVLLHVFSTLLLVQVVRPSHLYSGLLLADHLLAVPGQLAVAAGVAGGGPEPVSGPMMVVLILSVATWCCVWINGKLHKGGEKMDGWMDDRDTG